MKTQKDKVARNEWVRQQRLAGRSMKSIADELGLTENAVHCICKKVGCCGVMVSAEAWRENTSRAAQETAKRLRKTEAQLNEELRPYGFEYVSGYEGCDSMVKLRCLKCGAEIERNYNFVRTKHKTHPCPECQRIEREQRKARDRQRSENRREIRRQLKAEQLELSFCICKQCGQPFVQTHGKQAFCSDRCRKAYANRRKDRRLTAANIIDKDITLERLYKRDSGVCYLCGKACDWTDYIVKDGVTICGDNYPSIEHVEPISKGGLHSWANVKLACRGCNTAKHTAPMSLFLA